MSVNIPEDHHLMHHIKSSLDPSKTSKSFDLGSRTNQIFAFHSQNFFQTSAMKWCTKPTIYIFSGENQYNTGATKTTNVREKRSM